MSRSKYWYQPLYCPPGGWLKREKSESSSSSCGPSCDFMKASAIFGQTASMIAAPGWSISPSRLRSSRLPPLLPPADQQRHHLFAVCWFGACEGGSRRRKSGTVSIARTS